MPLRGKKQSNVITNVHGVRFTQSEAKSYLNLIKNMIYFNKFEFEEVIWLI